MGIVEIAAPSFSITYLPGLWATSRDTNIDVHEIDFVTCQHPMAATRHPGHAVPFPADEGAQAVRGNKQENRLTAILGILQQAGSVSVEDLRASLDVSVVTIRRDL